MHISLSVTLQSDLTAMVDLAFVLTMSSGFFTRLYEVRAWWQIRGVSSNPLATPARFLWKPWIALIIAALSAGGIIFFITARPTVPRWFKYDPAKPYEIFEAWKHLSTRKAAVAVGPSWTVLGGVLKDEWGRPLANTPIHFEISSRHGRRVDFVTDAKGYFLVYGNLEVTPTRGTPRPWDRIVSRLPNRVRSWFPANIPTVMVPTVMINVDTSGVYACPGYPDSTSGRAFAKSRNELRLCRSELLLKGTDRVFYQFVVRRHNTFTPSGLAAFEKISMTSNPPTAVADALHSVRTVYVPHHRRLIPQAREGSTERRARNLYQICILNSAGQPVSDALLEFRSYDGFIDNEQVVKTDRNGAADLEEWLLTGTALKNQGTNYFGNLQRSLWIEADSLAAGPIECRLRTNGVNVIRLKQSASVAGKVVDEAGNPRAVSLRILYTRGAVGRGEMGIDVRPDGSFFCEHIMADEPFRLYGLFDYESAPIDTDPISLSPGEVRSNLFIKPIQAAALRGIITDGTGGVVDAWRIGLEVDGRVSMIAEGHQFGFQGIGQEPFRIRVDAQDHLEYLSDPIQLEPGELRFLKLAIKINPGKVAVKPLRDWLEDLQKFAAGEPHEWARDAVRKIGTNALPQLFTLMHSPKPLEQDLSSHGFEALGKLAKPAIPELIKILRNQTEQREVKERALHALVDIHAEEAVPVLIELVEGDGDHRVKDTAIWALGRIGKGPEIAVPLIMKILASGQEEYRISCLYALGDFGTNARVALPLIMKALEDKDAFTRRYAGSALRQIDSQPAKQH